MSHSCPFSDVWEGDKTFKGDRVDFSENYQGKSKGGRVHFSKYHKGKPRVGSEIRNLKRNIFLFILSFFFLFNVSLRHWNTGLVSSRASLTSWGEGASLALVGDPSGDIVTIKIPYGVDVLHQPGLHPIFSYWVG